MAVVFWLSLLCEYHHRLVDFHRFSMQWSPTNFLFLYPNCLIFCSGGSSGWLLCSSGRTLLILEAFLLSGTTKYPKLTYASLPKLWNQPFVQRALAPFSEGSLLEL